MELVHSRTVVTMQEDYTCTRVHIIGLDKCRAKYVRKAALKFTIVWQFNILIIYWSLLY
jgi:hypothetical protein